MPESVLFLDLVFASYSRLPDLSGAADQSLVQMDELRSRIVSHDADLGDKEEMVLKRST